MKKNHFSGALNRKKHADLKHLFVFKKLVFILFMGMQLYSGYGYAQNHEISIQKSRLTIEQALEAIEHQSDFVFLYNSKEIDVKKEVLLEYQKGDIQRVLKDVLKNTNLVYRIVDQQIILSVRKKNNAIKQIKGIVVDTKNNPLIGVNVRLKGSSTGTITGIDGDFVLQVQKGDMLVFSYVGYKTKEIKMGLKSSLKIVMEEDTETLEEVVVTALGIKRETKSLTYNVQEMKAADLTSVKDANFINSISGKIAGVNIKQSASGIGGSSRVIMRGSTSLFGNNNALYVVDGIPLTSLRTNQDANLFESPDGGDSDGISSLNPDDIESISVLTGAASAALYGTQGANGVILITTKKGKEGKLRVNYSNDSQFMSPFVMPEFQNTYGSPKGIFSSWGKKMTRPNDWEPKDFFQTGYNETNSLSVSVGTDKNQTYFSAASTNSRGIIPNNKYNRYNFTLRNTAELIKDRLTLDLSASYVFSNSNNMVAQGQYHNPLVPLYLFPRGDNMNKYKVYERYNSELYYDTQFWPYKEQGLGMENPYWIVNKENLGNKKSRYMFTAALNYEVLPWMNIIGRLRVDNSDDTYTRKISASSSTLFSSAYGNYMNMQTKHKNTYGDVMAQVKKRWEDWSVLANVGASFSDNVMERIGYEGHLLTVPNLFTFSNIDRNNSSTKPIQSNYHDNNQGVFGTLQLGYKSWAFLDLTGRNDWYSSLAFTDHEKSGFFYYSLGLSTVISEIVDLSKYSISFLKLRGSYSEVGNAPMRYNTNPTYALEGGQLQTLPNVPATFLKPERTKSFELGANLRLFKDLINFDLTYYNTNTYNQFFTFTMPPSSGYSQFYLNGGKVNNWGIEASLGIKKSWNDFKWRSNVTFTMNRNEIKELLPKGAINPITHQPIDVDEIEPFAPQGSYKMVLKKGGTINDIYVTGLNVDHQGNVKVDPQTGKISTDPNTWIKAGSNAPRYNWGVNNTFSYKGFRLNCLISARIGGVGVSATQALMDRFGTSKTSAEARMNGGSLVNGHRIGAEDYYTVVGSGDTGALAYYVYSMTNVRLKELSLGYTLPTKWYKGLLESVDISLIGKNLFMFYNKAPFDPEITASTGTYYQGFDYFMQPSLRSLGFSVKIRY